MCWSFAKGRIPGHCRWSKARLPPTWLCREIGIVSSLVTRVEVPNSIYLVFFPVYPVNPNVLWNFPMNITGNHHVPDLKDTILEVYCRFGQLFAYVDASPAVFTPLLGCWLQGSSYTVVLITQYIGDYHHAWTGNPFLNQPVCHGISWNAATCRSFEQCSFLKGSSILQKGCFMIDPYRPCTTKRPYFYPYYLGKL